MERINYTIDPLSLKDSALLRIAVLLWKHEAPLFEKLWNGTPSESWWFRLTLSGFPDRSWKIAEDMILEERMPNLRLPKTLEKKLCEFVKHVGIELLDWCRELKNWEGIREFNYKCNVQKICWTSIGRVDKKKTAELLIRDENLDVASRYELAYGYCLEDHIASLWSRMDERQREFRDHPKELVDVWKQIIERETHENLIVDNSFKDVAHQAAILGNQVATDYFLAKLSPEDRHDSLLQTAEALASIKLEYPANVYDRMLCSLLSQMDGEQQLKMFTSFPASALGCLLVWPFHRSRFLATATQIQEHLDECNYYTVLKLILCKVSEGLDEDEYQVLFEQFWHLVPYFCKRYAMGVPELQLLLSFLLDVEDNKNFVLLVNSATRKEKRNLFFSEPGQSICLQLIRRDRWDTLRILVNECIISKWQLKGYRDEFKTCVGRFDGEKEWNQLFDDLYRERDGIKRERPEEEGHQSTSGTKKLRQIT